jgi:predicted amidohydrolase YtcJ
MLSFPRLVALFLALLSLVSCTEDSATSQTAEAPDTIITQARIYSFAWQEPSGEGLPAPDAPLNNDGDWQPDAEAIAITGGVITAIGSHDEILTLASDATQIIDLEGATVLPGFTDSHTHIEELGATLDDVNLKGVADEAEAVARVVAHLETNPVPAGQWIVARGWDDGLWADRYPTHDLLTAAVPNNPVLMDGTNGFGAWGNKLAMEAAGIIAGAADPVGGEILRDASGEPTGAVRNRGVALYRSAVPPLSDARLQRRLVNGLQLMADAGYTAVHHAGVDTRLMAAYEALAERGELSLRVYAMISGRDKPLMDAWKNRGPSTLGEDNKLFVKSVKGYYDGSLGARGAKLLEEYSDRPGHRGVSGEEYGFFTQEIGAMLQAGFQINVHAIGDGGNREVLHFLQDNFAINPALQANRHRIEHAQVVHPEDFALYDELDVIASVQPPFVAEDKVWTEDRIGHARSAGAYAWRSFRRNNTPLAFGSDLMGYDWNLFYGLHSAITRQSTDSQPPGGWFPEEKLTVEESIRGYTSGAAYAAFLEDQAGTLEVGKWADLTVVDIDPFSTVAREPAALLQGRVLMTLVGGKTVYAAEE